MEGGGVRGVVKAGDGVRVVVRGIVKQAVG